jgi:hypothetical protein
MLLYTPASATLVLKLQLVIRRARLSTERPEMAAHGASCCEGQRHNLDAAAGAPAAPYQCCQCLILAWRRLQAAFGCARPLLAIARKGYDVLGLLRVDGPFPVATPLECDALWASGHALGEAGVRSVPALSTLAWPLCVAAASCLQLPYALQPR